MFVSCQGCVTLIPWSFFGSQSEATDPAADTGARRSTLVAMTAVVWHFWIAVPLAASGVLVMIMLIAGYVGTVSRARYPRD